MRANPPLNFASAEERTKWIIAHADYFTIIRKKGHTYVREEKPTLIEALARANSLAKENPHVSYLVYAVAGTWDTFVHFIRSD